MHHDVPPTSTAARMLRLFAALAMLLALVAYPPSPARAAGGSGLLDTTFNPGSGAAGSVNALAMQSDGKLVIGGNFTMVNGTARNFIARLGANGSLDTTFNPGSGANGSVAALAVQPDGKVVIGGNFTQVNGTARNRIARLDGGLSAGWADGDTADKTISLPIVDDALLEGDETVVLTLTPQNGAVAGTPAALTLTITSTRRRSPAPRRPPARMARPTATPLPPATRRPRP